MRPVVHTILGIKSGETGNHFGMLHEKRSPGGNPTNFLPKISRIASSRERNLKASGALGSLPVMDSSAAESIRLSKRSTNRESVRMSPFSILLSLRYSKRMSLAQTLELQASGENASLRLLFC